MVGGSRFIVGAIVGGVHPGDDLRGLRDGCGDGLQPPEWVYDALCQAVCGDLPGAFLRYCGPVSQNLLVMLADYAATFALEQCGALVGQWKRINNVIIELLQNVRMHGVGLPSGSKEQPGALLVAFTGEGLAIQVFNVAPSAVVGRIRAQLQVLNRDNPDNLRARYRIQLVNGRHTAKGGAGLGLIKVVRQSAQPLRFRATALVQGVCLLCFSTMLPFVRGSAFVAQQDLALDS